jgi:hypothetical protein
MKSSPNHEVSSSPTLGDPTYDMEIRITLQPLPVIPIHLPPLLHKPLPEFHRNSPQINHILTGPVGVPHVCSPSNACIEYLNITQTYLQFPLVCRHLFVGIIGGSLLYKDNLVFFDNRLSLANFFQSISPIGRDFLSSTRIRLEVYHFTQLAEGVDLFPVDVLASIRSLKKLKYLIVEINLNRTFLSLSEQIWTVP